MCLYIYIYPCIICEPHPTQTKLPNIACYLHRNINMQILIYNAHSYSSQSSDSYKKHARKQIISYNM